MFGSFIHSFIHDQVRRGWQEGMCTIMDTVIIKMENGGDFYCVLYTIYVAATLSYSTLVYSSRVVIRRRATVRVH